jgi:hypothetical protein
MKNIRVFGLSRLDSLDLKKQFPQANISFESTETHEPQHGELATAAVIALSMAGIQVLGAWLLKSSKGKRIEKTLEIVNADGSKRTERFAMETSESTTEADVVKELAKTTHFDLGSVGASPAP